MPAEKPTSVTENELVTALRTTLFPVPDRPGWGEGEFTLSDLAGVTSAEVADVLFTAIGARHAEANRWAAGGLYARYRTAGDAPKVYQRMTEGWLEIGPAGSFFPDGLIDTTSFQLLTLDVPAPPYPAEDGPLKGDLFPEFEVRTPEQDEHRVTERLRQKDANLAELTRRPDPPRHTQVGTTPPPLGSQGPELRAHNHEGDGTVEGCRGCFPATGPGRELAAEDRLRRLRATEGGH